MFDIETSTWTELAPLGMPPSPRVSASAVVVGNKIYFFGGYDGTTWRNDTFTYNIGILKSYIHINKLIYI